MRVFPLLALLSSATWSCTDASGPSNAGLSLFVLEFGPATDLDGYTLSIDGGLAPVVVGTLTTFDDLQPGTIEVELSGIQSGCSVEGSNPREVALEIGTFADVIFEVFCTDTGSVTTMVNESGSGTDPDGYLVEIAGLTQRVDAGVGATLSQVIVGNTTITLSDIGPGCEVVGDNPRTALVMPGTTAAVNFNVVCDDSGTLQVLVLEVGTGTDPDGYSVEDDGVPQTVQIGTSSSESVSPGLHTVELLGVDADCVVLGNNPRFISVATEATSRLIFEVACGGPLLVGSFSSGAGGSSCCGGSPPTDEFHVSFGSPDVFDTVTMTPSDVGTTITITSAEDADLPGLLALMTDGVLDSIPFGSTVVGASSGSGAIGEDWLILYPSTTDFIGAILESMALRVDLYDTDRSNNGFVYDIDYSMLVLGYPPTSAAVLGSFTGDLSGRSPALLSGGTADFSLGLDVTTAGEILGAVGPAMPLQTSGGTNKALVLVDDDPDFAALADLLTNSEDDCLAFRVEVVEAGLSNHYCILESQMDKTVAGTDFDGFIISAIMFSTTGFTVGSNDVFVQYEVDIFGLPED